MRRFLKIALAAIVVSAVGLAAAAYAVARRSLPMLDGTIDVTGPAAPIEIIRDADAIPHVLARTKLDALFGLGYVHAQDRLWQMEFQRRVGFGRLAEVLGPAALPQDTFLRTVGFGRAARSAWDRLPARTRSEIEAYVAGINAFIGDHRGSTLPPEFTLLRFQPEPWTGADVVVWQKMLAWDLSANYSFELLRHDLVAKVGDAGMRELMPPYPHDGLSILGSKQTSAPSASSASLGRALLFPKGDAWAAAFEGALSEGPPSMRAPLLGAFTEGLGSNSWVVDGTMTASGKPLLANDPHLTARAPSIWYLAHVSGGDYDAIGATIPGTPSIVLGRNRFIAWGLTNMAADVQDLYREKLDDTGRFAEFRGVQEPLQFIAETIAVKGRPPVRIDVRVSRHGPLVSDAINIMNQASPGRRALPPVEPLAFRWTALDPDDTTVAAMMRVTEARDWSGFTAALRDFVVPSQNFLYADVEGHIGYVAPGRVPIRAAGDGTVPVDGWSGDAEWRGWVPFDALPHTFDPPGHAIVTANNRPAPPDYPHLLGVDWAEPFRAQRIVDRLRERAKWRPDDFAAIQGDTVSLYARETLPALLTHVQPHDAADADAIRLLRRWNYEARGDSAAAAIFESWTQQLTRALVDDDLGPLASENYAGRYSYVSRFVLRLLGPQVRLKPDPTEKTSGGSSSVASGGSSSGAPGGSSSVASGGSSSGAPGGSSSGAPGGSSSVAPGVSSSVGSGFSRTWCDDSRTPTIESCDDIVSSALHEAVADLTKRMRGDMGSWRWDGVLHAVFPHQGLDSVALLRPLLSRTVPSGGDWSTLNVGVVAADGSYEQRTIASYREIVDLSSANDSRFADALGQSGHFLSNHYADALGDWRAVRHKKLRMERSDIERGAMGHLRLEPRRP